MDAVETATRIRAGVLSPVEAVVDAVDRAKQVNGELNAIIAERFDEAIEAVKSGELNQSGPLAGVPTLIKDLLAPAPVSYTHLTLPTNREV